LSEINIHVTATDDASAVMEQVASNASGSMNEIKNSSQGVTGAINQTNMSTQQTALAFNNAATSGMALIMAAERVQTAQVQLDRANLMVQRSTESVEKTQTAYNDAVAKYGPNSQQAKDALDKLNIAQDALRVAQERADLAQRNLNNSWIQAAMTVIPSLITMVTSLSKAISGLSGLSGTLSSIGSSASEALSTVGAAGSAVGGGGSIGGGILTGGAGLGGALAGAGAVVAIPIAADFAGKQQQAISQNPTLQGLMTIKGGGAIATGTNPFAQTAVIAAATAAQKTTQAISEILADAATSLPSSNITPTDTLPGLGGRYQHGGIITKPTIGLIGEAGPEAIIPLGSGEGIGLGDINITLNIEGSVDRKTAEYTIQRLRQELKNVIVEATSTQSSSTHKRIRNGAMF
jgi:hypothetical protein